jgi:hypothetical protein
MPALADESPTNVDIGKSRDWHSMKDNKDNNELSN